MEYHFWCWKHKLQGVLQLLSILSGYTFSETDADAVSQGLRPSSADQNQQFEYDLSTTNCTCRISMAPDEDDSAIVFITATTSSEFLERIIFISQVQDSLKTIEIELD